MASGTLGQAALAATTNTTVYTVPAGKTGSFTVNFQNRAITSTWVRLAIATNSTPTASEYVLYDVLVGQYGTLEKTGLVASAGKNIVVYSSTGNVSVNVYGFEE